MIHLFNGGGEVGKKDSLYFIDNLKTLDHIQHPKTEDLPKKMPDLLEVQTKNPLWGDKNAENSFSRRYDTWAYSFVSREPYFVFDKNHVLLFVILPGDEGSLFLSNWIILDEADASSPRFYHVQLRDIPENILKIFNNKTIDRFLYILNALLGTSSLEGTIMYTSSTRTRGLNTVLKSYWMPGQKYDFKFSQELILKTISEHAFGDHNMRMAAELQEIWPNVLSELENFYAHKFCVDQKTAHQYAIRNSHALLHGFLDDGVLNELNP